MKSPMWYLGLVALGLAGCSSSEEPEMAREKEALRALDYLRTTFAEHRRVDIVEMKARWPGLRAHESTEEEGASYDIPFNDPGIGNDNWVMHRFCLVRFRLQDDGTLATFELKVFP